MKHWHSLAAILCLLSLALYAQQRRPVLTPEETAIQTQLGQLRKLPDAEWTRAVAALAKQIHDLPADAGKEALIGSLGNLVTEGDAGHDTLQTVASTMSDVLKTSPDSPVAATLAQLVRFEHLNVKCESAKYAAAMAKLQEEDKLRESPDFTLQDIHGKTYNFKDLRGKVVLVNFWATWCPPCRKEMPDMETLSHRFGPQGLVILAISDETLAKVEPFIAEQKYTYPILLDPDRKVNKLFSVSGIPKSFLYGRDGKLVAEAVDRRTESQFLAMLKQAGLE